MCADEPASVGRRRPAACDQLRRPSICESGNKGFIGEKCTDAATV